MAFRVALYRYLIFDLDETLYPRDAGLMQEIGTRITRFMVEQLGFTAEEARTKRDRYYRKFGTSLRGLILEETVETEGYLRFVHDIDLRAYIGPHPELDAMLDRIPLVKAIFTNASSEHAQHVLAILGISAHFQTIIDIRATQFINKPDRHAYQQALARLAARAEECILVEDNPRNLTPARALGMKTILVDHTDCAEVDFCVSHILEVEEVIRHLLRV